MFNHLNPYRYILLTHCGLYSDLTFYTWLDKYKLALYRTIFQIFKIFIYIKNYCKVAESVSVSCKKNEWKKNMILISRKAVE